MPFSQIKKGIFDTLRSAASSVGVVSEIEISGSGTWDVFVIVFSLL